MPPTSSSKPQVVRVVFPAGHGRVSPGAFVVAAQSAAGLHVEAVCYMHDTAALVRDDLRTQGVEAAIYRASYLRFIAVDTAGKVLQDNEAEADLLG